MLTLINQQFGSDCHIACLRMICVYYGKEISPATMKSQLPKHSYGNTFRELSDYLNSIGIKTSLHNDFKEEYLQSKPAILAIDLAKIYVKDKVADPHMIVIQKNERGIMVYDPLEPEPFVKSFEHLASVLQDKTKQKQKELLLVCQ